MSNSVVEAITQRARQAGKTIVLPEAEDPRVLQAARAITDQGYAKVVLLGEPEKVAADAAEAGAGLEGVEIVDPKTDADRESYIEKLLAKRQKKGMTREQAEEMLNWGVYYGGWMVGQGRCDGMVCGSNCPTADTVRSAIYGVGTAEGCKTVSSCSLMLTIVEDFGVNGAVVFADTGVVPEPTAEQLADIAVAAAGACRSLLNTEPRVAMVSFSTKGSASSPAVDRVIEATKIAQQRRSDLKIDGEMQVDAAMVPSIGQKKAPGSDVAGQANTLVFPDLSCGNSAYKLVERFGKATALGPLLLGLAKPINDLSRGCSVEDIVLITAITAVQAD